MMRGLRIGLVCAGAVATAAFAAYWWFDLRQSETVIPVSTLPVEHGSDTMAILFSGDAGLNGFGWNVAKDLAAGGVPVVGFDTLRYFWSPKSPRRFADDVAGLVSRYGEMWHAGRVALVGFSYGADLLPAAYLLLPPEMRDRVALVTLLAPSGSPVYEIEVGALVSGWIGLHTGLMDGSPAPDFVADLQRLPLDRVQCFYGEDDIFDVCRQLAGTPAEAVEKPGGHSFDGDSAAIAAAILARLGRSAP